MDVFLTKMHVGFLIMRIISWFIWTNKCIDGAQIINLSVAEGNTVNEDTTATLRCLVDSNPESNITWIRQGIMGTLQTNFFVHESQLIIEHAECLDTSNYTCNARNGLGHPVEKYVPLFVTCHPRTDFRSPPVTKVHSKLYGNAILIYTVISFPEPSFNWTFLGNGSENRLLPDYATKYDNGLQSVLMFKNLSINDFGFYKVIAKNMFPTSAMEVFQIIPADVPDIPFSVTVTDVKQTSLTVHWVAGYNGGPEQTFHIMITDSYIKRSVYAPDPGYGKLGTQAIKDLIPNTEYSISMSASNSLWSSNVTNLIIQITLKDNDVTRKREERHDASNRQDYEGLHIKQTEASQYLQLNGFTLEENRNTNIRSPENDSDEKLHMYANNDI